MRVAMISPIAWRTPPRKYGPWELVTSLLTEALVERGVEVTLFATADSLTSAELRAVCEVGYEEDPTIDARVWQCMHYSEVFESADEFDLIHNHFDFPPLTYSSLISTPMLTTIHGFSSSAILPVYKKYNGSVHYVSISDSDRSSELDYVATVYNGVDISQFTFQPECGEYLIFFGRVHPDKGTKEAIEIASRTGRKLVIAGLLQDREYFARDVEPHIDGKRVVYAGNVGPEKRDELLGGALALLHPISFDEPFGLSMVESMACGTPVIAFNRGSMPEIISHEENGLLVSNVDEAVMAVGEVSKIDRRSARRRVEERFTVDRMAEGYLRVYEHILNGGTDCP